MIMLHSPFSSPLIIVNISFGYFNSFFSGEKIGKLKSSVFNFINKIAILICGSGFNFLPFLIGYKYFPGSFHSSFIFLFKQVDKFCFIFRFRLPDCHTDKAIFFQYSHGIITETIKEKWSVFLRNFIDY